MIRKASIPKIIIISAIIIVVIAGLNLLAFYIEHNFAFFFDISHDRIYSVSEETIELCDGLSDEVIIYFYNSPGNEDTGTKALLESYNAKCRKLSVINLNRDSAESFVSRFDSGAGVSPGSIIVTNKEFSRYRLMSVASFYNVESYYAEQRISSAIRYVDTGSANSARFLMGHRETDLSTMSKFTGLLGSLDFQYSVYDALMPDQHLDPDSDILIAVSPKTDLIEAEYEKISEFLGAGGKAIFFMDSFYYDSDREEMNARVHELPLFAKIFEEHGMLIGRDIIFGKDTKYTNLRPTSLIVKTKLNEMTRALNGKSVVISEVSSIVFTPGSSAEPVLETNSGCASGSVYSWDAAEEQDGGKSFCVAALCEDDNSSIMLFGSSSIISNDEIGISGNEAFTAAILDYAADTKLNIPAKDFGGTSNFIVGSYTQKMLIVLLCVCVIPAIALITGVLFRRMRPSSRD